jgi:hypothetical protein
LYIELDCLTSSEKVEIRDGPFSSSKFSNYFHTYLTLADFSLYDETRSADGNLAKFVDDSLQKTDTGWQLSFEWEALQPQRTRLIKPILYAFSPESATLSIKAKVFADTFPEPFILQSQMNLEVKRVSARLDDVLPKWEEILERQERSDVLRG